MIANELEDCNKMFERNIVKGIADGHYRKETDVASAVRFYYTLIFSIHETIQLESEANELEFRALEYHTRAIATSKGIIELEKQLSNLNT
jgi:hypothetical protein